MHAIPEASLFSRADALALGWTDSSLMRAVRSGRLVRVRRGQFTAGELIVGSGDFGSISPPDDVTVAVAAARACTGSVISHRAAAVMQGAPIVGRRPHRPDLTLSPPSTGDTAHALLHRATLRPHDIVMVDGQPVTSPARTAVDLGRSCPTATAVAVIDYLLHERLCTRDEIADVLDFCRRWPGIRRAERAVRLSDARSESPLESVSRLVIGAMMLPAPEPQATILDRYGVEVGRLDFYWDEYGVGGEADGRSKYDGRDVISAEKDRQERIEDLQLPITRWQWRHTTHPQSLRLKIEGAFARGRARDAAGLPRLWAVRPCATAR